jgi:hypothetical protein
MFANKLIRERKMISNLYAYPNHDNMKMKRINELHCRAEEPTMTLDG